MQKDQSRPVNSIVTAATEEHDESQRLLTAS